MSVSFFHPLFFPPLTGLQYEIDNLSFPPLSPQEELVVILGESHETSCDFLATPHLLSTNLSSMVLSFWFALLGSFFFFSPCFSRIHQR